MASLPQVQCPNCKGFKTEGDSKKQRSMMMGGGMVFLGIILNLFTAWLIGMPLMIIGFVMAAYARNTMKEDGSMKCKACGFQFKTDVANIEPPKVPWWKYER